MSVVLADDQDWRAGALCASIDPDIFFAVGAREHREAKSICKQCPVRTQCLVHALEAPIDHGIWGGMTERERRRFRRQAGIGGWQARIPVTA
jgi:WhiB family redox-sensing transcriptional regulator